MNSDLVFYSSLLNEIKDRIRQAQIRAAVSANSEMILMYWDIGRMIHQRQQMEGWGAGIIPRLSRDIRNELPEVKGFSERNIGYMFDFSVSTGIPQFCNGPLQNCLDHPPRMKHCFSLGKRPRQRVII